MPERSISLRPISNKSILGDGSRRPLIGIPVAGLVATMAHRKGSLSTSGAVAASVVGTVAFARSWRATAELLTFFVASTALSHLSHRGGRQLPRRNAAQVVANGGIPVLAWTMELLGVARSSSQFASGALAAAAADTWATEIGGRWGGAPHDIVSGKMVKPGESGGITAIGLLATAAGASTIALVRWRSETSAWKKTLLSGICGALVDSVLGAVVQARYICPVCESVIEEPVHCGADASLVRGKAWMTNDTVNLLAALVGGCINALLSRGRHPRIPQ